MLLLGKVAVVTGAGRGIGRAIALRLARAGADVVVADRSLASAKEFDEELGAATVVEEIEMLGRRSLGFEGDLTQRDSARDLALAAVESFGRIDILVNNVGGALTPMERSFASQMTDEDMDFMFKLNYSSAVYCSQEVLPYMRKSNGGSIVNVSSRAGIDPAQRQGRLAPYGIAKSSILAFTRYLAHEVGPDGVRVNCIAPGSIATSRIVHTAKERGISTEADLELIPLRRFGTAEDIAGVAEFLAGENSAYITGQVIAVDGGTVLTAY